MYSKWTLLWIIGLCSVAGKMASISEGNSDISDFVGFTEEDLVENISVVPDSEPDSSDIEVSSVGSSDISDLGDPEDEMLNIANSDVNVAQEATWTTSFGDVNFDAFEQPSGPNLSPGFDTATATPLDYFELHFKTEMFGKIVNLTNIYAVFKRDEIRTKNNDPEYADPRWSDTSVSEMRALFGINILMGVSTLPQYHLYWHKDKFIGSAGVKDTMTLKRYEKLMQYLHVSDRATEPTGQNCDKLYKIWPVLEMVQESFKAHYNPDKNQMVDEVMIGFRGSSPVSTTCLQNQSSMVSKCG